MMLIISILVVFGPAVIAHYFMFKSIIISINQGNKEWQGPAMALGFIWLSIIAAFFGLGLEDNCSLKYCL